jgi:hypothetical protein
MDHSRTFPLPSCGGEDGLKIANIRLYVVDKG